MSSRVPVLMYHKVAICPSGSKVPGHYVAPTLFRRQVRFLKMIGFQTVAFDRLFGHESPRRPLILSFDDGYENFHTHAWPVLRALEETATVFLVSELTAKTNEWDTQVGDVEERLLNQDQITELSRGGIEFGSHTCTHADLTTVDPIKARREICDSRHQVEALAGKPAVSFCYPYGRYSAETVRLVRECGYRFACTVEGGMNTQDTDPLKLRRVNVRRDTTPSVLLLKFLRDRRK